jgi:formylglycine-generating enzyme required for sulfatase activity
MSQLTKRLSLAVVLSAAALMAASEAACSNGSGGKKPDTTTAETAGERAAIPAIEFVQIHPGTFQMGCSPGDQQCLDTEMPAHMVNITKTFYLGRFEVTQAQWQAVMGTNPSRFKGDSRPVERVSWNDAQDFIAKLNARKDGYNYRLPTEAEWEYAARAGNTDSGLANLGQAAWFADNSGHETHPVGQKAANKWGLYDMQGNVWEWMQDWHGGYPRDKVTDPIGPTSAKEFTVIFKGGPVPPGYLPYRVLRGGSFDEDDQRKLRLSFRFGWPPQAPEPDEIGLRLARGANP